MNDFNHQASQPEEERKYLLNNEAHALLVNARNEVKNAVDIIPSMRKMINELVTVEAVEAMTQRLIRKYK